MHEPGVGRMRDRLGLHGRVHRHPLKILGLDGTSLVGNREALLDQRHKLFFAQALTPARQRAAIER
jgi:hypothetical protein